MRTTITPPISGVVPMARVVEVVGARYVGRARAESRARRERGKP